VPLSFSFILLWSSSGSFLALVPDAVNKTTFALTFAFALIVALTFALTFALIFALIFA